MTIEYIIAMITHILDILESFQASQDAMAKDAKHHLNANDAKAALEAKHAENDKDAEDGVGAKDVVDVHDAESARSTNGAKDSKAANNVLKMTKAWTAVARIFNIVNKQFGVLKEVRVVSLQLASLELLRKHLKPYADFTTAHSSQGSSYGPASTPMPPVQDGEGTLKIAREEANAAYEDLLTSICTTLLAKDEGFNGLTGCQRIWVATQFINAVEERLTETIKHSQMLKLYREWLTSLQNVIKDYITQQKEFVWPSAVVVLQKLQQILATGLEAKADGREQDYCKDTYNRAALLIATFVATATDPSGSMSCQDKRSIVESSAWAGVVPLALCRGLGALANALEKTKDESERHANHLKSKAILNSMFSAGMTTKAIHAWFPRQSPTEQFPWRILDCLLKHVALNDAWACVLALNLALQLYLNPEILRVSVPAGQSFRDCKIMATLQLTFKVAAKCLKEGTPLVVYAGLSLLTGCLHWCLKRSDSSAVEGQKLTKEDLKVLLTSLQALRQNNPSEQPQMQ